MMVQLDIRFPPEWLEGREWVMAEAVATVPLADGARGVFAGGVLDDDACLLGLVYPGGQRVLRCSSDYGIEERFEGRDLGPDDKTLTTAWGYAVKGFATALAEQRAA